MSEELITKKELLDMFGISYGALYRWKRKNLIPDQWFIHKATITGQETFFPKSRVIERVETIIRLKDVMSLDEIAEMFMPGKSEAILEHQEIINYGIADSSAIKTYTELSGKTPPYGWDRLLELAVFVLCGEYDGAVCAAEQSKNTSEEAILYVVSKNKTKISFCFIQSPNVPKPVFTAGCDVTEYHISEIINELNNKLSKIGG